MYVPTVVPKLCGHGPAAVGQLQVPWFECNFDIFETQLIARKDLRTEQLSAVVVVAVYPLYYTADHEQSIDYNVKTDINTDTGSLIISCVCVYVQYLQLMHFPLDPRLLNN